METKTSVALQLLLNAHRLKHTPRTGWVIRGVPNAESVADHSFGVAIIALLLTEMMADLQLDRVKVLTIALLHDLPESITTDIPSPVMDHFPEHVKHQVETTVLAALLDRLPGAEQWQAWWQEFEDDDTREARLVHDADRLDMLIQAYIYEQTTGNRWLDEFWSSSDESLFGFEVTAALYNELVMLRQASGC